MENDSLVLTELALIRKAIGVIQEKIEDITLSGDDLISIQDYKREKENGELFSEEQVKKELGLDVQG